MHKLMVFFCAAMLCGIISTDGQTLQNRPPPTATDDRLAALKALKIDAGAVPLVEHADSPTLTLPDGHTPNNLPPRMVVELVLNPAKGGQGLGWELV